LRLTKCKSYCIENCDPGKLVAKIVGRVEPSMRVGG
jgi:hypothetical protein